MPARHPEGFQQYPPDPPPRTRRPDASNRSRSASGSSGGLLSNVLSFVSREIGEFVVNATGGPEPSTPQSVAGPSRRRDEATRRTEKRHRRQSAPTQPSHDIRVLKRVRREVDFEDEDENATPPRTEDVAGDDVHELSDDDLHNSSSPPSRRPRRGSISMPGSLFSRSPTPDSRASPPDSQNRHVRFASDVVSPVPRQRRLVMPSGVVEDKDEDGEESLSDEDYDGGQSSSPEREDGSLYLPLPSPPRRSSVEGFLARAPPTTPFRQPAISSVKDVIARLDGDSPSQSTRPATPTWSAKGKGKANEFEHSTPFPSANKGKSKEATRPRLDAMPRSPSTAGSVEGARRVELFLRSETFDTEADVEEHTSRSTPKDDADKRRIRELEDMVESLQNELARSRSIPPPPPPPPPPMLGSSSSRIPLSTSPRRGDVVNGVYASVRAGLRQTSNPSIPSKAMPKNRLPIVPADKMEAFLSELKTVKLRKVGSGENLSRDSSRDQSQSSSQGNSSFAEIGFKRKRVDSGNEAQSALVTSIKRRFVASHPSTFVPPSSVAGPSSRKSFIPPRHPSTVATSRKPITNLPELHGPTPSLCSDNSNEIEERAPSTPPLRPTLDGPVTVTASSTAPQRVEVEAPRERHREPEIRDLHTHEIPEKVPPPRSPPQRTKAARSQPPQSSQSTQETTRSTEDQDDPFARRLPSSPMLPETPRRPRPPARVRSATQPAPASKRNRSPAPKDASDDDPLSMTFSPPNEESTPAPEPIGRRRRRRLTLEDELRKADSSYSYSEEERAVTELESGELVGVGQRSKQLGFLAHGGAGGDPVFMGVGYVESAAEDTQTNDSEKKQETEKKRTRSSAGGKRRPKR